jgi:drug/metabolite transporter (DMT)-like permease
MTEILDEIGVKNNRKSFSKLSLINSLITLGLVVYLFSSIPKPIKASEGIPEPPMIIVISTQLLCLIGIIMMILSFTKKEPSNWFKWIGALLNILLFLTIVGSVIFARIV